MSTLPIRTCVNGNALYSPTVNAESIGKAVTWTMTVNTTGAIFVETGTSAPLHRIITGVAANDAVAVKVGPNAGTLTVVLSYDGTDEGSCSASRIVRKVAVTASYPPLKCAQDLATVTAVATTQTIFNGPFNPSPPYLYTLLPEGTQNITGVFTNVAAGPHTILAKENLLEGCEASTEILINAPPVIPVIAHCPGNVEKSACVYDNQDQVAADFAAFVAAFSADGGTGIVNKVITYEPAGGLAPDKCGGQVKVTIVGTDECQQTATCSAIFKINTAPAVITHKPDPLFIPYCQVTTKDALLLALDNFKKEFTKAGGCNPQIAFEPIADVNVCGGEPILVRAIVTDKCIAPIILESTFTVGRPLAPHIDLAQDVNIQACDTQDDIHAKFIAFLLSVKANSECGALEVTHNDVVEPDRCVGGDVVVTFRANPNCFPPLETTAHFRVPAAPKPHFTLCPEAKDLGCNPVGLPVAQDPGYESACLAVVRHIDGDITGDACNKRQVRTYFISTECYADADKCEQVFTWKVDNGIQNLQCAAGKDLGCNPNLATDLPAPVDPTFISNCPAIVKVTDGPVTGTDCLKEMIRTYNVSTDCFKDGVNCTQRFTWKVDLVKPIITKTAQGPTDLGCNPTAAQIEDALGGATALDNCDGNITDKLVVATGDKVSTGGCGFSITRTFDVEDLCGNIADRVERTVTWKEQAAPKLVCAADVTIACDAQIVHTPPTAGPSCGPVDIKLIGIVLSADGLTSTATWEATNECGLKSAQCSQVITKEVCDFNGCTLGYWKTHTQAWDCYQTCTKYGEVFVNAPANLKDLTLLQVLNLGGNGNCENLGRQSVAALLNICDGTLNFHIGTIAELQAQVNAAFLAGDCVAFGAKLDGFNNEGGANHCNVVKSPNDKTDHCNNANVKKGVDATGAVAPLQSSITKFIAFPNPYRGYFNIEVNSTNIAPMSINVYDMLGRHIDTRTFEAGDASNIQLGKDYPIGMYNLILNQATEVKSLRIIKE
jgi:hypothetical protein